MDKVCYSDENYKVIHNNRNYVLINLKGEYENHGHLKKLSTCLMLIKLMKNNIVPKSKYLQYAVLRISLDEKYKENVSIKQDKNRNRMLYININKGVKK